MRFSLRKALRLSRQSFALRKPHHVQWMLTRRCNYRCKSCDVWRDERPVPELSTEEVKAGLDSLRDLGAMELVLSGGNPLLREDIKEIIDYASQYFITTIYDNGSQAVNRIDALQNADFVAISLDTLNCKKYDYLKVGDEVTICDYGSKEIRIKAVITEKSHTNTRYLRRIWGNVAKTP